ncbi:MIF4G domain and MA3 domain-containing protein isoform 6 [Tripterygium wilfordii]|uniref:MIF4G domain and MA3 domain-containing protein isoform 6 n=1 Tax=Tripterygium wilfordii TaxID=458696 RepID=A0A7J7DYT7_TRIWF|nr:MIF4G domain and MA3 domain-containing protein isoform 6 [Tripterygium wilfordii]
MGRGTIMANSESGKYQSFEGSNTERKLNFKSKMVKGKNSLKGRSKTKFEEFLEMDMKTTSISAEEDLKLERKLAKKLKVKDGKLREADDDIDMLIQDISSVLDSSGNEATLDSEDFLYASHENHPIVKKCKSSKSLEKESKGNTNENILEGVYDPEETNGAHVVLEEIGTKKPSRKRRRKRNLLDPGQEGDPLNVALDGESNTVKTVIEGMASGEATVHVLASDHATKYVAPHLRSRAGNESEEQTQIRRRVRGLLNRLSESNIESVTAEIASIFHSVSRSVSSQIFSEEVLASCSNGPRGNEQYAAVFAAFVAGIACSVGIDFGAKLIASLATTFEAEYLKEDNLSLRNLTLLLSYLCIFGVCSCDLIYDFLIVLSKRLTEIDVSTILTVLQCCGMKIRVDDPAAMINFIQSVQSRVNQLKACFEEGQTKINGKRMEFMLETICDIKNNKKRSREDTVQHTRIKKWLQKLRVEDILLRGLKWSKLLDPNKKGQWWLSGDMAANRDNIEEVASTIDKEVLEAQKMLQLAAAQRMNTDARRAIFCIIMSGEDYIDAFEKLLRMGAICCPVVGGIGGKAGHNGRVGND